jgi:hypothetical protein
VVVAEASTVVLALVRETQLIAAPEDFLGITGSFSAQDFQHPLLPAKNFLPPQPDGPRPLRA